MILISIYSGLPLRHGRVDLEDFIEDRLDGEVAAVHGGSGERDWDIVFEVHDARPDELLPQMISELASFPVPPDTYCVVHSDGDGEQTKRYVYPPDALRREIADGIRALRVRLTGESDGDGWEATRQHLLSVLEDEA